MDWLVPMIKIAGVVHIAVILANFALPKKLRIEENLRPLPPIIRQIFLVHWLYILIVLLLFAALCFFFAEELAGGSEIGRFLSGFLCVFWTLRIVLQLVAYDRQVRRDNQELDFLYMVALAYFAVIFGIAAWRGHS